MKRFRLILLCFIVFLIVGCNLQRETIDNYVVIDYIRLPDFVPHEYMIDIDKETLYLKSDKKLYEPDDIISLTLYNPLEHKVVFSDTSLGLKAEKLMDGHWETYPLNIVALMVIVEMEPGEALNLNISGSALTPGIYRLSVNGFIGEWGKERIYGETEITVKTSITQGDLLVGTDMRSYYPDDPIVFTVSNATNKNVTFNDSTLGIKAYKWVNEQWKPYPLDIVGLPYIVELKPGGTKKVQLHKGLPESGVYLVSFQGYLKGTDDTAIPRTVSGKTRVYIQPI